MKIGIVGVGLVGSAIKYGFEKLGHKVWCHDIKLNTSIDNVVETDICFICVPTPSLKSGKCDIKIVKEVIEELNDINYKGVIAIKSTIEPGTTKRLVKKYVNRKICFVPEFLRERCAIIDFIENHDVCIIGTSNKTIYNIVKEAHGKYPKKFVLVNETEAELTKYFNNVYNASLITFANNFYELCLNLGVDYNRVKTAIVNRSHINDVYLDCNENLRGFGGACLPKDTAALGHLVGELNIDLAFFKAILEENKKYQTTVFDNMRLE